MMAQRNDHKTTHVKTTIQPYHKAESYSNHGETTMHMMEINSTVELSLSYSDLETVQRRKLII
jgi:hypothetical protein